MNKKRKVLMLTFKCVDCGTKNETANPPTDNMLQCSKCGFVTVQYVADVRMERR